MNNVFARILGEDYSRLPRAVKNFHEVPQATFQGFAIVRGSTSVVSATIRRIFNFPVPAEHTPVTIEVERNAHLDQWRRDFAGRKFSSTFSTHQTGRLLSEVFGPFRFYFSLSVSDNRLNWHFERWSIGPVPLPKALGPRIVSWESENQDGSYRFFSQAHFPVIGLLIYYDGFANPSTDEHAQPNTH